MARVNGIGQRQWEDERALESPIERWKREELVNWLGRRLASPVQALRDSAAGYPAAAGGNGAARSRPDGLLLARAGDGSSNRANETLSGPPRPPATQARERRTSAGGGAGAAIPAPRAPPVQPAPRAATPEPTHRTAPAPRAPIRQTEPARRAANARTQQSARAPSAEHYAAGQGAVASGARDAAHAGGRQRGNRTAYVDLGVQWATGLGPGDQEFGQDDPATQTPPPSSPL
jgi:hypothetical protein